jgi:N-acetylglutamate synthase-like GNAT family acetyltransferase
MLTFRPALERDWPAIEAMLVQSALPLEGAREHLDAFLLALDDGALVATTAIESYGSAALLRSVAVATSHRGRGIGEAVLGLMILEARRRNVRTLHLLTTTAESYFSQRGFAKESRADAPSELQASAEFRGACPASATFMTMAVPPTP